MVPSHRAVEPTLLRLAFVFHSADGGGGGGRGGGMVGEYYVDENIDRNVSIDIIRGVRRR